MGTAGWRRFLTTAAVHMALCVATVATLYPVLWVVKMALTPSQSFSMGVNPLPTEVSLANLATRAGVEGARFTVHTPLMDLDKAGIVRLGVSLGVDYGLTHSCYDPAPDGRACWKRTFRQSLNAPAGV